MDSKHKGMRWKGAEDDSRSPWERDRDDILQEIADAEESNARGHWTRVDGDEVWVSELAEPWSPPPPRAAQTRADWLFHCMARMWMLWREEAGRISMAEAVSRVPEEQWVRMFEEGIGIAPRRGRDEGLRSEQSRPAAKAEPPAPMPTPCRGEFRFGRPLALERQMRPVWDDDAEAGAR